VILIWYRSRLFLGTCDGSGFLAPVRKVWPISGRLSNFGREIFHTRDRIYLSMRFRALLIMLSGVLMFSVAVPASGGTVYPWIEGLDGVAKLTLRAADGKTREAGSGEAWALGETIQLPAGAYARVAFPDGAQLLLPPGVQVRWEGEKPFLAVLEAGTMRVLVEKPKAETGLRFMVRTPDAILGVRGTDFTVAWTTEATTEVHTMTGWVEMTREESELKRGLAVPVRAGERLVQPQGKPYEAPAAFDRVEYLKALNERFPALEQLWQSAVRSAKTGELIRKAERVRGFQRQFVSGGEAAGTVPSEAPSGAKVTEPPPPAPLKMKRKSRRHWRRHR